MAWIALIGTALLFFGGWRYAVDTRDGLDWQPWRICESTRPSRRL